MLVCGVDDAGRGSVLGPLVIAGISIEKRKIRKLYSLGVRDSKKLTPLTREHLYKKILEIVDGVSISKIYPKSIDKSVAKHQLNFLEARCMAKVIVKLNPRISYVDSCDVNPQRFGKTISKLSNHDIRSYHHADSRFVVVSAASIVAKVTRDRAIQRLRKKYDIGSGYPSDSKTINFVKQSVNSNPIPAFIRKSWRPVQKLIIANWT